MKKLLVIPFLFMLLSCCWFQDCDDCEKIEEGIFLADLILSNFEPQLNESDEGQTAYTLIHTVLNLAMEFDCPDEVKSAGDHQDGLELIYSKSGNFDDAMVIDSQIAFVNQGTDPGEDYQVFSEIVFELDGSYIINNKIDDINEVEERDETNNTETNPLVKSSKLAFRSELLISNVLVITKDMVGEPKYDKNNNLIYISKWDISVH